MRSAVIALCVFVQVLILAAMVYGRESVILGGERIYLRTAPIDPRDPFRGDYVRLRYAMNSTDAITVRWDDPDDPPVRGDRVFAVLSRSYNSVHEVDFVTDVMPESGLFIRGRVGYSGAGVGNPLRLKFGIEQLFVQQGEGITIEEKQGVRGGMQVPLEVEVAVNARGVPVLTGSRWSPLGIEMELVNLGEVVQDQRDAGQTGVTDGSVNLEVQSASEISLRIRIENTSDNPVTINTPANDCGFTLETSQQNSIRFTAAYEQCSDDLPPDYLTLQPDDEHVVNVDLSSPRWHIKSKTGEFVDLRQITTNEWFRIVYRSIDHSKTLNDSELWQGELPSQAFNARGWVD